MHTGGMLKWWPLLALLLISSSGQCDWLDLNSLSIDYVHYTPKGRSPLVTNNGLPDRELGDQMGINLELGVTPYFYWANRVHGTSDRDTVNGGSQFRAVGWQLELGARVVPQVDIFYHHHSQHVLDYAYPAGFPVEDGVGFRLRIVEAFR